MSLMTMVVDPVPGRKIRIHNRHRPVARPTCLWGCHWCDRVHGHDGGSDEHSMRPCNGNAEMKMQMGASYNHNGMPEAWDDMNNGFLEPDKLAAAGAEDEFLQEVRRLPASAARHDQASRRQARVGQVSRHEQGGSGCP